MASGLLIVAFAFLADRGFYEVGIYLSALGLAWQMLAGKDKLLIPRPLLYLSAFYFLFILEGTLLGGGPLSKGAMSMGYAVLIILCFLQIAGAASTFKSLSGIAISILIAFIVVNGVYDLIPNEGWRAKAGILGTMRKIGYFRNPHWLAQAVLLVFPLMVYLAVLAKGTRKTLYSLLALSCLALILLTNSAACFLALAFVFFILLWYSKVPTVRRFICASAFLVCAGLVGSYLYQDGHYLHVLVEKIAKDERWKLWQGCWHVQGESTLYQWVFGHGFEAFGNAYNSYALLRGLELARFQHNMVLEVLYSNGIFGLSMLSIFLVGCIRYLQGILSSECQGALRAARVVVVAICCGLFIDALFLYPFVSREFQLPLAFVMASAIYLSPDFLNRIGSQGGFLGQGFERWPSRPEVDCSLPRSEQRNVSGGACGT